MFTACDIADMVPRLNEIFPQATTLEETTTASHTHPVVIDEAVAPTCTETGLTTGAHCSACGEILVAQEIVPATGEHAYSFTVTQPTANKEGYTTYTCSVCDDIYIDNYVSPTGSVGLSYTVNSDRTTCTIIGIGICTDTEIYISEMIDGYKVTSIDDFAFYRCDNLTEITIPNSVTTIGDSAFFCCSNLTSVTIPDSVTTIGDSAFSGCSNLTSVTIPDSVTTIGYFAFEDCSNLTSVTIGDSVTTIGDYAFLGCSSLTSVMIPNSVTTIGGSAFSGCSNLTSIVVDENNTAYQSINGNLYSKDGTVLMAYAIGKTDTSFAIPDSVTTIGLGAFAYCSNLTSVIISDSVTTIGEGAFFYSSNFTSVTIPDSVTIIGDSAFAYCSNLTSITFEGTVAQWNAISKGYDWKYYVPATSVICSDGTVTLN